MDDESNYQQGNASKNNKNFFHSPKNYDRDSLYVSESPTIPNTTNHDKLTLYRSILDSIPDAIVVHQNGVIQFANQGAVELMALPENINPHGMTIWSFFHPSTVEGVQSAFKQLASEGIVGSSIPSAQHKIVRHNGTIFTGEIRSILIDGGEDPVIMSLTRDVSTENELKSRLKYIAYHDALTSLPNRRYLTEFLDDLLRQSSAISQKHSVLFIDMDRFKNINDSYGHEFGDEALSMMAQRLQSTLPEPCFLARIGGDEFAVVCSNVAQISDATTLAEAILNQFTSPILVRDHEFVITPSIGISMYPDCGTEINTLLKHADLAMYSAKRRGGNQFDVYHPEESDAIEERLNIEHGIRLGLQKYEFTLHYQPKIELQTGRIRSVEALIRWVSPNGELIPPAKFIPVAEESGLIASIGKWVLLEACHQNKLWQDKGHSPLIVSVNVSPKQFQLVNMQELIQQVLAETGLSPEWLEIEITEGLLIQNSMKIMDVLNQIRAMGVNISIDDFGNGYSSFNYLRLFKPNLVKIDQSFISNMLSDDGHFAIVSAIIHLAHSLNMSVIAEGVEELQQLNKLKELGCNYAQGFLFSRPVTSEQIEQKWL